MTTDIPDYVLTACRRWGKQKRRIWKGEDWYINSRGQRVRHIDGYASSLLGRIREERDGASQQAIRQRWEEVFWGDGLDVQRTLPGMPESPLCALHLNYVWDPEWAVTAKRKAEILGSSLRVYWDELKKAQYWVFARLEYAHDQSVKIMRNFNKEGLQVVKKIAINTTTQITSPKLSFSSLSRPTISIVDKKCHVE